MCVPMYSSNKGQSLKGNANKSKCLHMIACCVYIQSCHACRGALCKSKEKIVIIITIIPEKVAAIASLAATVCEATTPRPH